ncbi:MAG TPA: hypothetical protein VF777_13360 [Phycisphaerales bacterium]
MPENQRTDVPPTQDAAVDAVQRDVMETISPDGRPPEMSTQRREWKWFWLIGIPIGIGAVVVFLVALGPAAGLLGLIILAGMMVMAVPAWGAGLLRGQEERVARNVAEKVVRVDSRPPSSR